MKVGLGLLLTLLATSFGTQADRLMVPSYLTCPRDFVTSWTGEVYDYKRQDASIQFKIATDADTTESLSLTMANLLQLENQFFYQNRPFKPDLWPVLEEAPGKLAMPRKATVWVCLKDDIKPVINWIAPPK